MGTHGIRVVVLHSGANGRRGAGLQPRRDGSAASVAETAPFLVSGAAAALGCPN
jgi:hypothetical protein